MNLASKLSDPRLEARLLAARALFNSQFLRLTEVANDGFRSEQLIGAKAPWQRIMQLAVLIEALIYLGRPEEALKIADTLEPLAKKFGHPYAVALCHWTKAWIEFGTVPDLAKLENTLQEASKPEHIGQSPYWEFTSQLNLGMVNFSPRKLGRCSVARSSLRSLGNREQLDRGNRRWYDLSTDGLRRRSRRRVSDPP